MAGRPAVAHARSSLAVKKILTVRYLPGCPAVQDLRQPTRPSPDAAFISSGRSRLPTLEQAMPRSCPRNCPCGTSDLAYLTTQTAPDLHIWVQAEPWTFYRIFATPKRGPRMHRRKRPLTCRAPLRNRTVDLLLTMERRGLCDQAEMESPIHLPALMMAAGGC